MMDVWLLFNLLYPFAVVLVHTYMDTLRNDDEREFNHHGKTMKIGEDGKATEKDESESNVVKVNLFVYTLSTKFDSNL